jgi:hypothetical protein
MNQRHAQDGIRARAPWPGAAFDIAWARRYPEPVTADPRAALAAGLALLVVAVALVMLQSPLVLAGENAVRPVNVTLGSVPGSGRACQKGETLPAGTTVIAVSLETTSGPRVAVTVSSGGRVLTRGESASGWIGKLVAIPVKPLKYAVRNAAVCVAFTGGNELMLFLGVHGATRNPATSSAGALPGRMSIEYLRPGRSSWWSLALGVARRMGLGRAWAGTWIVLLVAALMAASVAVASWLALREA